MVEAPDSMRRRALRRQLRRAAREAVRRSALRATLAGFAHQMATRALLDPSHRNGEHLDRALIWGAMRPDGTVDLAELEALEVDSGANAALVEEITQSFAATAEQLRGARP